MFTRAKLIRETLNDFCIHLLTDRSCINTNGSFLWSTENLALLVSSHLLYNSFLQEVWLMQKQGSVIFARFYNWFDEECSYIAPDELMTLSAKIFSSLRDHRSFCTESKRQSSDISRAQHEKTDFKTLLANTTHCKWSPVKTSPLFGAFKKTHSVNSDQWKRFWGSLPLRFDSSNLRSLDVNSRNKCPLLNFDTMKLVLYCTQPLICIAYGRDYLILFKD